MPAEYIPHIWAEFEHRDAEKSVINTKDKHNTEVKERFKNINSKQTETTYDTSRLAWSTIAGAHTVTLLPKAIALYEIIIQHTVWTWHDTAQLIKNQVYNEYKYIISITPSRFLRSSGRQAEYAFLRAEFFQALAWPIPSLACEQALLWGGG